MMCGIGLFATRAYKPGEVVVAEWPLVSSPVDPRPSFAVWPLPPRLVPAPNHTAAAGTRTRAKSKPPLHEHDVADEDDAHAGQADAQKDMDTAAGHWPELYACAHCHRSLSAHMMIEQQSSSPPSAPSAPAGRHLAIVEDAETFYQFLLSLSLSTLYNLSTITLSLSHSHFLPPSHTRSPLIHSEKLMDRFRVGCIRPSCRAEDTSGRVSRCNVHVAHAVRLPSRVPQLTPRKLLLRNPRKLLLLPSVYWTMQNSGAKNRPLHRYKPRTTRLMTLPPPRLPSLRCRCHCWALRATAPHAVTTWVRRITQWRCT